MKKNITIISNAKVFKKTVAQALAHELEMIYADFEQMLEYNLINSAMLQSAGQNYYDKQEHSMLKKVSSYVDTILTLEFSTLNKPNNKKILKSNTLIIYLSLNYDCFISINKQENDANTAKLNDIVFAERDCIMSNLADIVVHTNALSVDECIKQIISAINTYYSK